jgi:hypothetical protein
MWLPQVSKANAKFKSLYRADGFSLFGTVHTYYIMSWYIIGYFGRELTKLQDSVEAFDTKVRL